MCEFEDLKMRKPCAMAGVCDLSAAIIMVCCFCPVGAPGG